MKTPIIALLAALTALGTSGAAQAGDVTINLTGVQARGGQLLVSLQTRDQYRQQVGFGDIIASPTAGTVRVTFRDVPAGDYALSVLHDENGDFQMQSAANGLPMEGWAASRGAELRSDPTFDMVKVEIPAAGATLTEPMFYWDGRIPGQ